MTLRVLRRALDALRHAPLTVACVLVLWAVGLATGAVVHGPSDALTDRFGTGLPALAEGRWWTPLTYGLWSTGALSYAVLTVLFLVLVAPVERRIGTRRAAILLGVSQVGGALLGIGAIKVGAVNGEPWMEQLVAYQLGIGPTPAMAGLGLGLSAGLTALWRRRVRLLLVALLLAFALYVGEAQDVLRLAGGVVGLLAGIAMFRRTAPGRPHAPSHAETRVLVALLVAVAAIGPLVSYLADAAIGPLAIWSGFYLSPAPDPATVADICAHEAAVDCLDGRAQLLFHQFPAALMGIVPALLTLVVAEGLRRGRRFAWWLALVLTVAVVGYATYDLASYYAKYRTEIDAEGAQAVFDYFVLGVEPLLLPLATIVVLVRTRRHFDLPADLARKVAAAVLAAFLAASALYLGVGYLVRDQFQPAATFGQLLADLPSRFVPPAYPGLPSTDFLPVGGIARALYRYCGLLFWLVTLCGLLVLFRRSRIQADDAATRRARQVLTTGGSALSYLTTWPGNHYWFTPDGRAAVAYRVIGTVALTTGDPIGPPADWAGAVGGFARFCADHGWTPCLYSVTAPTRAAALALDWQAVQVAEDTRLELPTLAFSGKKWQDVRTALNNATKAGITAEWFRYPDAPLALKEQILEISEEWVADKGLPEMGFTLGGLDELDDPEVRCLVAVDAERKVHGITSWMPVYADGAILGWTLDFMRRRSSGFRGVMEFLIASAALGLKEEGFAFLSLSGAPMARLDRGEQPAPLQKLLDFTGRTLEPVYGFRSLLAFKAKFQPVYEPMFMAYPDSAALPTIANAIGRAYLPHMTAGQGVRLIRKIVG